jgi:hypothetical protein
MNGLAEVERDHVLRALAASNWVIGWRSYAAALGHEANVVGLQDEEASYNSTCGGPTETKRQRRCGRRLVFQAAIAPVAVDPTETRQ